MEAEAMDETTDTRTGDPDETEQNSSQEELSTVPGQLRIIMCERNHYVSVEV